MTITRPGEAVEVRLEVRPRVALTGSVVDADGVPVADAWVTHFRSDLQAAEATAPAPSLTDSEGRFLISARDDVPYTISVASPAGSGRLEGVRTGADAVVRVSAPASVRGVVQTSDQHAVPEFVLTYERDGASEYEELRGYDSAFIIPMLSPGSYTFGVRSALGVASRTLAIKPGETVSLTLTKQL